MGVGNQTTHPMRALLTFFRRRSLASAILTLATGTAAAQAIGMMALPFLTRLYTPRDFAALAAFTGLVTMVSTVAALRYEIAIPIPERKEEAAALVVLAVGVSSLVCVLSELALIAFGRLLIRQTAYSDYEPYLWILGPAIFFLSMQTTAQNWHVREANFSFLARNRFLQSTAAAAIQIGLGRFPIVPLGLVIGSIIASAASMLTLGTTMYRRSLAAFKNIKVQDLLVAAKKYRNYPTYSTIEAASNMAGAQLPLIFIAAMGTQQAGYLALAIRLMQAPLGFIGGAVAQVFLSQAPEQHRAHRLAAFTSDLFGGLVKAGAGPIIFAVIVSPRLIAPLFGPHWAGAGMVIAWLAPSTLLQLITSPLSMAMYVVNAQKTALQLQFFGLILRCGIVFSAEHFASTYSVEAYCVANALFYALYLGVIFRTVGCSGLAIMQRLRNSVAATTAWVLGAIIVHFLIPIGSA